MAGPQCSVPAPPCEHESSGSEELIGPFLSYISHPPLAAPKAAVILVSDVFGFKKPLLRKLADKVAALGYMVVLPDYFNGDPKDAGVEAVNWLERHQPIDMVESTRSLVEILKNKGLSLVGAVGFCWGAKVVVEIAKGDHLKVAIMCHPSLVTVEDIKDVKTPMAILGAEVDMRTPPALVEQFREILDSKDVPSFVKIYKGTVHGWVVRYDVNNVKEVEMAEEAHQKVFEWLNMYLQ